jgi:predicted  nucleic acid-binding Zn-ribbon protein
MRREFEEGVARRQVEIRKRLEKVEHRWEVSEEARQREWEALEGRLMTAYEENRHFNDGLLRKMTVMTEEYIKILREGGAIFQKEMAEGRAQLRANTEAVLKALDRLPPPQAR